MSQVSRFPARLPRDQKQTIAIWNYFFPQEFSKAGLLLLLISVPLLIRGYIDFKDRTQQEPAWSQVQPSPPASEIAITFASTMTLGLVPFLIGIGLLIQHRLKNRSKLAEPNRMDHILMRDAEMIKLRALRKIEMRLSGGDPSLQPAFLETALAEPQSWLSGCFETDPAWGRIADAKPSWRQGNDQTLRFLIHRAAILVLAEHHLAYYLCDFNLATGLILKEEVVDCHYKDVHMIKYVERKTQAANALHAQFLPETLSSKDIDLSTRGLEIAIGSSSVEIPLGVRPGGKDFDADSMVDPIVSRIRFLLREKRRSYVRLAGSPVAG